jgi:hypothetical protein
MHVAGGKSLHADTSDAASCKCYVHAGTDLSTTHEHREDWVEDGAR